MSFPDSKNKAPNVFLSVNDATGSPPVKITSSASPGPVVVNTPPSLPPVLTLPTTTSITSTGATIGATTDVGSGIIYAAVTTSPTPPTAEAIMAGTGFAAAGNRVVTSAGAGTLAVTGLSPSTTYYHYHVQSGSPGGNSNVLTSPSFSTAAAPAAGVLNTFFGQTINYASNFPLSFYPEAWYASYDFLSYMSSTPSFYDFESATVGATTLNIPFGSITATLSGQGQVRSNSVVGWGGGTTNSGRFSVSGQLSDPDDPMATPPSQGSRYWEVTAPASGVSSFRVDFSGPVKGFGFYATDVGDFSGLLSVELTLMDNTTTIVQPGGPNGYIVLGGDPIIGDRASGSVLFFGISASAPDKYFKTVRFISQGGLANDLFGFDMLTVIPA